MPRQTNRLKRPQEIQDFLLLRRIQVVEELLLHSGGFTAVAGVLLNRVEQVRGAPVVQQEDALSEPPQRSGAELVAARAALRNVIRQPRAHVVDLDIGEGRHGDLIQTGSDV